MLNAACRRMESCNTGPKKHDRAARAASSGMCLAARDDLQWWRFFMWFEKSERKVSLGNNRGIVSLYRSHNAQQISDPLNTSHRLDIQLYSFGPFRRVEADYSPSSSQFNFVLFSKPHWQYISDGSLWWRCSLCIEWVAYCISLTHI